MGDDCKIYHSYSFIVEVPVDFDLFLIPSPKKKANLYMNINIKSIKPGFTCSKHNNVYPKRI